MRSSTTALDSPFRLTAIRQSGLLESLPQEALDRLTRLATRLLETPVALVSLVTQQAQHFASQQGLAEPWRRGTPLSHSFCRHVVETGNPLVIDDAPNDARVSDNPAVAEMDVKAYAGVPLAMSDGRVLGSFCAIDNVPRQWTKRDLESLRDLAAIAAAEIETRVLTTARAEAERAARASANRFRATFEQAAVGMAHVSPDGRWQEVNQRLCDMLGYSHAELLALAWQDVTHPDDVAGDSDLVRRLIAGEMVWYRTEKRYLKRDRTVVWALLTVSLVRDAAGEPDYFIAVAEDVTKRKRAELALQASEMELIQAQEEVLERLAQAAELRDDDTGMHTRRVGDMSARIAAALSLPDSRVELVRRAAALHDVGKIGVPDRILRKPGGLTVEERSDIEKHAAEGARILSRSEAPLMQLAEVIAHAHHERWDGTGYPRALAGEDIPLEARIVAVADVYDALTHERPYRPASSHEEVVAFIESGAGSHFDPRVVDAFLQIAGQRTPTD